MARWSEARFGVKLRSVPKLVAPRRERFRQDPLQRSRTCRRDGLDEVLLGAARKSDDAALTGSSRRDGDRNGDASEGAAPPFQFTQASKCTIVEIRCRLEPMQTLFPKSFGDVPVENRDEFNEQLCGYRADRNGAIVKEDDHGRDALSATAYGFSPRNTEVAYVV